MVFTSKRNLLKLHSSVWSVCLLCVFMLSLSCRHVIVIVSVRGRTVSCQLNWVEELRLAVIADWIEFEFLNERICGCKSFHFFKTMLWHVKLDNGILKLWNCHRSYQDNFIVFWKWCASVTELCIFVIKRYLLQTFSIFLIW